MTQRQNEAAKKHSEFMKQRWQNPEYRRNQLEKFLCARKKRRNYVVTFETRIKQSESKKKNWQNPEYKQKQKLAIKRGHDLQEYREKARENAKRMPGETNPNWRGGISFEPYSQEFNGYLKKQIQKRDNYTCQCCGSIEMLQIHHIDYNKKNNALNNLITLCLSCNVKVNYNRAFWKAFFIQKMLVILPNYSEKGLLTSQALSKVSDLICQEVINTV